MVNWTIRSWLINTTKKRGYPSVLKSAGIAPKSAGIGSKFLSRHFFSRRFRLPLFECGDRVVRTCTSTFQKCRDRSQRFQTLSNPVSAFLKALGRPLWKCEDNLYQHFWKAYTSAFESAGIGSTYSSAFQNAGIGLESV